MKQRGINQGLQFKNTGLYNKVLSVRLQHMKIPCAKSDQLNKVNSV